MIRKWDRESRVRAVEPAEVAEIEARIARLEAQIAAGAIEREDVLPALAALSERRRAALAAGWRRTSGREGVEANAAVAAYARAVEGMREALAGPIARARAALHEILGDVVCRPEGEQLVALVGLDSRPLLKAAGIRWSGSGGAQFYHRIVIRRADSPLE
jgi:non-ribosomal peptide synthetase component F